MHQQVYTLPPGIIAPFICMASNLVQKGDTEMSRVAKALLVHVHVCPYGTSSPNGATTANQCMAISCTSHFDCSSTTGAGGLVGAGITCNMNTNTCGECPAGSYCPQYWRMKQLCPPGRYGNTTGTSSLQAGCPYECPTGTISTHGSTDSSQCTSKNSTNTKWCTTKAGENTLSLMIAVYRTMSCRLMGTDITDITDIIRMSILRRQFWLKVL